MVVNEKHSADKLVDLEVDQFGYRSVHLVNAVPEIIGGKSVSALLKGFHIEIQVRTMAQNLWADISHSLGYKSPFMVPNEIKRRLYRLAALTEIIDDNFLNVKTRIDDYKESVRLSLATSVPALKVNRETILVYYDALDLVRVDEEIAQSIAILKKDGVRTLNLMPINLHLAGVSDLLQLDNYIRANKKRIVEFARLRLNSRNLTLQKGIFLFYLAYDYVCATKNEKTVQQYLIDAKIDYSDFSDSLTLARNLLSDHTTASVA